MKRILPLTFVTLAATLAPTLTSSAASEKAGLPDKMKLFDVVQGIMDGSCVECHGEKKAKGKLRLDSYEAILKGGKGDGPGAEPKSLDDSSIWYRVTLEHDDDDFMPPADSDAKPLTPAQLYLIKTWIEKGADNKTEIASADLDAGLRDFLVKQANKPKHIEKPVIIGGLGLDEWAKKRDAIAAAKGKVPDTGASLMPLSQKDPQLRLNVINAYKDFGDAQLTQLKPVGDYLVWADLARSQVTDAGLGTLAGMPHLERLHLQNTGVTTAGVKQLAGLKHLKSLNLHGTKVDDSVLPVLASMKSLENVYLWGSAVTPDAAKALRAKMPNTTINIGWEHEPPVKVVEAPKPAPAPAKEPEPAKKPAPAKK